MLDLSYNIKIIDFGLAGIKTHHDIISDVYGTLPYLSPEVVKGEEYNDKVDVWTLGVVCYQLMYLKFIFDGKNVDEIVDKILNSKIELDNIGKSEKEKKINEVILECLNRDVNNRPDIETISVLFCNEDIDLHI